MAWRWLLVVLSATCTQSAALSTSALEEGPSSFPASRLPLLMRGRVSINEEGSPHSLFEDQALEVERTTERRLRVAREAEAELSLENEKLRRELSQWQAAGAEVAAREARVVRLLEQKLPAEPPEPAEAPAGTVHLISSTLSSFYLRTAKAATSALQRVGDTMHSYLFTQPEGANGAAEFNKVAMLLVFVGFNGVGFLMFNLGVRRNGKTSKGAEADFQGLLQEGQHLVEPVLRHVGLSHYVIEVSEMQLGNWRSLHKNVGLVLQTGRLELRARGLGPPDDGLVRLEGTFEVAVRLRDPEGSCTFWVVDRDQMSEERLARVDITGEDLLGLVRRRHGEYFNFDLSIDVREPWPAQLVDTSLRHRTVNIRPFLAMRIRDASSSEVEQRRKAPK